MDVVAPGKIVDVAGLAGDYDWRWNRTRPPLAAALTTRGRALEFAPFLIVGDELPTHLRQGLADGTDLKPGEDMRWDCT